MYVVFRLRKNIRIPTIPFLCAHHFFEGVFYCVYCSVVVGHPLIFFLL